MKRLWVIVFACAMVAVAARSEPPYNQLGRRDGVRGNFGVFYSSLSPHGEWINFNFGYAWRPYHVAHGWRPYLYGRWVWSDYGWYWVSDESFGWATYHYGRWYYDDFYGWIWIPGDTWGPAWVEWRYDDDYIGWAPLSPYAAFDVRLGITFSNHWVAPYNYWNFVPGRNFAGARVVDYVQPAERTRRIFGNTRSVVDIRVDNDRVTNRGIDVNMVERRGNSHVDRVDVITRDRGDGEHVVRDGNRQRVEVFRPRLDAQIRGDVPRPLNARRAEHSISFDRPANRRSDGTLPRPDRTPDSRRDTRMQKQRPIERTPSPERKVEPAKPPDRGVSPERQIKESPKPDIGRSRREQQMPRGSQERRVPAARPAPTQHGSPQKEAPKENTRDRRDEPPHERR